MQTIEAIVLHQSVGDSLEVDPIFSEFESVVVDVIAVDVLARDRGPRNIQEPVPGDAAVERGDTAPAEDDAVARAIGVAPSWLGRRVRV